MFSLKLNNSDNCGVDCAFYFCDTWGPARKGIVVYQDWLTTGCKLSNNNTICWLIIKICQRTFLLDALNLIYNTTTNVRRHQIDSCQCCQLNKKRQKCTKKKKKESWESEKYKMKNSFVIFALIVLVIH